MQKLSLFILGFFLLPSLLWAQPDGSNDNDPVRQIHYPRAFDQKDLHEKYKPLMEALGCDQNVFANGIVSEEFEQDGHRDDDYVVVQVAQEQEDTQEQLKAFQSECVGRLKSERRSIILKPAKESAMMMGLMGGAAGGLMLALGSDSFGGSFGVFAAMFNSVWYLRDAIRSGYNLVWTPPHPLDKLEIAFAKNQCFIPHQVWDAIVEKFMLARQNPFEQRNAMNFIQFALSLTVFKERQKVQGNLAGIKMELGQKIETFFEEYQEMDQEQLALIKINVKKFIAQLLGGNSTPRYLYLHGEGGIGKTHFARALVEWINELLPDAVNFDEMTITSPAELEGDNVYPGAFLNVLSNQCRSQRPATIVFMDEANWLNEPSFEAPSKRVFNGDQAKLSTRYFGNGSDGAGLKLELPPMLIIVAGNQDIKDAALASRFDIISFPKPRDETLEKIALDCLEKSDFAAECQAYFSQNQNAIQNAIKDKIQNIGNFRAVKSRMSAILEQLEKKAESGNTDFSF